MLASSAWLATTAWAAIVELRFDTDGRFVHEASVAPGKFFEICGPLPAGQAVAWQYSGAAPLDFNIHYHVDKAVHYPARLKQTASAKDSFTPDAARDYCWMWTNRGSQAADLSVKLQRP